MKEIYYNREMLLNVKQDVLTAAVLPSTNTLGFERPMVKLGEFQDQSTAIKLVTTAERKGHDNDLYKWLKKNKTTWIREKNPSEKSTAESSYRQDKLK